MTSPMRPQRLRFGRRHSLAIFRNGIFNGPFDGPNMGIDNLGVRYSYFF